MKMKTWEKNKLLKSTLYGIIFAGLLFSFEFIDSYSNEYNNSKKQFNENKKENEAALKLVKEFAKEAEVYLAYKKVNSKYLSSKKKYNKVKKQEKVFGFKNLRLFVYNLFPLIALFGYILYNLKKSFRLEMNNIGPKLIHGVFLMYAFVKLFWIFQKYDDFNKPMYYIITLMCAYFVTLAVSIIEKQQVKKNKLLKKKLLMVSYHAMQNAKEEKLNEMVNVIKRPL